MVGEFTAANAAFILLTGWHAGMSMAKERQDLGWEKLDGTEPGQRHRRAVQTDCTVLLQSPCGPRVAGAVLLSHVVGSKGRLDGNQEQSTEKALKRCGKKLQESGPAVCPV